MNGSYPPSDLVTATPAGHFLSLQFSTPGLGDELIRDLTGPAHQPAGGGPASTPAALFWTSGDGPVGLETFAGLARVVAGWCGRQGLAVLGEDEPDVADWGPPHPRLARRVDPAFTDHAALELARRRPRGRVRTGGGVDPVRIVFQLAVAYPGRRILVLVTRRSHARAVRRRLAGYGVRASLLAGDVPPARLRRVAVATAKQAFAARPRELDLVVALDPHELFDGADGHALDLIGAAARARLLAVAPDRPLPPRLRLLVAALFGPEVVTVPGHGLVPRPTTLDRIRLTCGHRPATADPAELKREGVILHRVRNAVLARAAAEEAAAGRRVVVLADGVEHALRLFRLLPAAAVAVTHGAWLPAGQTEAERSALAAGRSPKPDRPLVIATPLSLGRVGVPDVLVRADGGGGPAPLPFAWTACRPGDAAPLQVVDTDDRHHPALRRRARSRVAAARSAGWVVAGDPPPTASGWFAALRREASYWDVDDAECL